MDPETRRFMWNYIDKVKKGRAIVLTTHSMEEADALCNSIGIMIRGQMRALGTSQELKSNHGEGFMVSVRISAAPAGAAYPFENVDALLRDLTGNNLKEEDSATLVKRYEIPTGSVKNVGHDCDLATIFEVMDTKAAELDIVDFSVSQTSLEDVFLKFARLQVRTQPPPTVPTTGVPKCMRCCMIFAH